MSIEDDLKNLMEKIETPEPRETFLHHLESELNKRIENKRARMSKKNNYGFWVKLTMAAFYLGSILLFIIILSPGQRSQVSSYLNVKPQPQITSKPKQPDNGYDIFDILEDALTSDTEEPVDSYKGTKPEATTKDKIESTPSPTAKPVDKPDLYIKNYDMDGEMNLEGDFKLGYDIEFIIDIFSDTYLDESDILLKIIKDGTIIFQDNEEVSFNRENTIDSVDFDWTPTKDGAYKVEIYVDSFEKIDEQSEFNNRRSFNFSVKDENTEPTQTPSPTPTATVTPTTNVTVTPTSTIANSHFFSDELISECSDPEILLESPQATNYWIDLGLDISKNPEIKAYRIQWFNGNWSGLLIPGENDQETLYPERRYWSYFKDHNHTFLQCRELL